MSELWQMGALELAALIRAGEADAVASVDAPTVARMRGAGAIPYAGDRYTDLRCLTIAAEIEAAVGRFTPIDPVTT